MRVQSPFPVFFREPDDLNCIIGDDLRLIRGAEIILKVKSNKLRPEVNKKRWVMWFKASKVIAGSTVLGPLSTNI